LFFLSPHLSPLYLFASGAIPTLAIQASGKSPHQLKG
jgi:hypothetical protein